MGYPGPIPEREGASRQQPEGDVGRGDGGDDGSRVTAGDGDSPQQRRLEKKRRRATTTRPGTDAGRSRSDAERSQASDDRSRADADDPSDGHDETVRLEVFRYDPDVAEKREPRFDAFDVPAGRGTTVLDALIYARDTFDPSLTFRHSCRMAVCGSDGFFVNGRQRLGCKTQLSALDEPVRVEPLPHQPVIKDLVVDMEQFYERMAAVEPYFQPDDLPAADLAEQRQSPENREQIKAAARCIQCGCCTSSCNPAQTDDQYIGPAAIVKGYRFYMDEREGADARERRLDRLGEPHGVWPCQTQFSCTTVCPKDIPITEEIQAMKREAVKRGVRFW